MLQGPWKLGECRNLGIGKVEILKMCPCLQIKIVGDDFPVCHHCRDKIWSALHQTILCQLSVKLFSGVRALDYENDADRWMYIVRDNLPANKQSC